MARPDFSTIQISIPPWPKWPRIRQRGERAEKVESLIYMLSRGRPHSHNGDNQRRNTSSPYRELISIQLFRSAQFGSFFPSASTPPIMLIDARFLDYFQVRMEGGGGKGSETIETIEKRLRATRVEGGGYQEGRCRNSICLLDRIYIPRPFHFALRPYDRYSLYLARFTANPRRASLPQDSIWVGVSGVSKETIDDSGGSRAPSSLA